MPCPLDFPIVFVALEEVGNIIELAVGVEGVVSDSQFVSLTFHDVDGVVEDPFHNEITQFRHHDMGIGEVADGYRKRADVVVMAMGERDGVDDTIPDDAESRQSLSAAEFRVHPGIHQ